MSKPLVLITGATGHIGFRTLVETLKAGYRVRISSRKLAQAEALQHLDSIKPYIDSIEFVEVSDFLASGAFDAAVQGVDYVLHLASPIPNAGLTGSIKADFLDPAVRGSVGMLESAAKAPSVKRVVMTSSVVILEAPPGSSIPGPDDLAPVPDPATVAADQWVAYRASKVLAHDAAQKYMASHTTTTNLTFDLVHVLPSYVQGRNELVTRKEDLNSGSNDVLVNLVLGSRGGRARRANTVLVDDVARVHVLALDPTRGARAGDRFIAAGSPGGKSIVWNDVTAIARRLFPDAVASGVLPLGGDQETIASDYDVRKTERVFGIEFAGLETQVRSLVGQYVELAQK